MADHLNRGRLAVRSGDCNYRTIGHPPAKLQLADDWQSLFVSRLNHSGLLRYTGALDDRARTLDKFFAGVIQMDFDTCLAKPCRTDRRP